LPNHELAVLVGFERIPAPLWAESRREEPGSPFWKTTTGRSLAERCWLPKEQGTSRRFLRYLARG
jgi:hypothetical protein